MTAASSLISHLNTANGNQASIHSKFKEWMDTNFIKGITFQWSSSDIKNIFGSPLITNDAVRSNCIKYFAEKCLEIGASASISDLCALVTTTDNEILKEEYCIVMGPITVDGDRSHLCSLFSNSIKAGNVKKIPFGTRKSNDNDNNFGDFDDNTDDDPSGGPPPGMDNPFGGQGNPFSNQGNPFGGQGNPFGGQGNPFGGQGSPFGGQGSPFGGQGNPFGNQGFP